jgi:hypothetical protein
MVQYLISYNWNSLKFGAASSPYISLLGHPVCSCAVYINYSRLLILHRSKLIVPVSMDELMHMDFWNTNEIEIKIKIIALGTLHITPFSLLCIVVSLSFICAFGLLF